MSDLNRREFVAAMAAGACAMCNCGQAFAAGQVKPVDVGELKAYALDGVTSTWVKRDGFFVIRQGEKIYALSSTCTHKGATLGAKDEALVCAKHGSQFAVTGALTKGPAKNALARLGISVNDAGHVIVDPGKQFAEDKWNDAGAFVKAAS